MGSVRRHVIIDRPADAVWAVVGDPTTLDSWFPGVVDCTVEGTTRVITTATGLPIPEEIETVDPIARRFQYRVTAPIIRDHLGTIDVFPIDDDRSLVAYSTNCEPEAMALMIGGATGAALAELRRRLETDPGAS
jgi:uncharacterized protein YndB with AHSA1/START domain